MKIMTGVPAARQRAIYRQDNVNYWTKRAPTYSLLNQAELAANQREVWKRVLHHQIQAHFPAQNPADIRVLDIGTGPGFFSIILAQQGYQVTAVDYTDGMLLQARQNAGPLADRIRFCRMDAQELTFEDSSFDVIVSRNVTWNLCTPKQAYAHWTRVLKPGGLLLNFDANWYHYLYDQDALQGHIADKRNTAENGAPDDTDGTDIPAMESIARRAPLSALNRPDWDLQTLSDFGMNAAADCEIWRRVWTRDEWLNNASTPMFMIHAVKPAS